MNQTKRKHPSNRIGTCSTINDDAIETLAKGPMIYIL